MKTKDGFQQPYNAEAGVDTDSRLIVGVCVPHAPNNKEQLVPTLAAVKKHVSPAHVLVDRGLLPTTLLKAAMSSVFPSSNPSQTCYSHLWQHCASDKVTADPHSNLSSAF